MFQAFEHKINEFNHHKSNELTQFLSNGITFLCCSYECPLLGLGFGNDRVCINDTSKCSRVKSTNAAAEIVVQVIFLNRKYMHCILVQVSGMSASERSFNL